MITQTPYSYTIAEHERILRITVRRGGSLRLIYDLVIEFTSDVRFKPGFAVIADTREGNYTPVAADLVCLAKMLGDMKDSFSGKIALIVPEWQKKFSIDLLCASARAKGFNAFSFTDPDAAEEWVKSRSNGIQPNTPDDTQ